MAGIQVLPPDKSYESQLAQELMGQGMAPGPVYSPMQGIGKLAQVWAGKYLMKESQDNATARQKAMTENLQAEVQGAMKPDGTVDPLILGKALMGQPETAGMGLQLISEQQKKPQQYRVISPSTPEGAAEIQKRGLDPKGTYQVDDATNQVQLLGAPKDPAKVGNFFNTKGYDEKTGQLVQVRKGIDENGVVHTIDTSPIPPKPMDAQSSKEQAGLITLADLGDAMRAIVKSPNFNWNGPISGPLQIKLQALGITEPARTNAEAFAALSAHYTPLFTSILGSRAGAKMLQRMDELRPSASYPVSRNIMQLDATDAVINSYSKELAGNFAGTGYNIDPRLIKLARKSGFDPNNAATGSQDFTPSVPQTQGGGQPQADIKEGATANGGKYTYKNGQWVETATGKPYQVPNG